MLDLTPTETGVLKIFQIPPSEKRTWMDLIRRSPEKDRIDFFIHASILTSHERKGPNLSEALRGVHKTLEPLERLKAAAQIIKQKPKVTASQLGKIIQSEIFKSQTRNLIADAKGYKA